MPLKALKINLCVYCVILTPLRPPLTLLKQFIPVNASGKRAATEPGKRTSKKAKSAAQKPSQPMVQPSTALPVQLIHPPYQKMPNPVQVFLLVQAGAGERLMIEAHSPVLIHEPFVKGNYPLGVSVEHLYDNFTAYATIKDFNVQHVTKDTVRTISYHTYTA